MAYGAGRGRFFQYLLLPAPLANERIMPMKCTTTGLEKIEDEILAFEVSDEALEIAAGSAKEKANFTLGACSGLSVCPG
jgi:hypothetical protein